jgi:hypothetical protein
VHCDRLCLLWANSGHHVGTVLHARACFAPKIPGVFSLGGSVRPRLGVPLVLWAFVLPRGLGCAPTRETETEARRGVHLARGVGRGGGRLADGCGAGVLGQWRQHSQQAPRRLMGHGMVFRDAARRQRYAPNKPASIITTIWSRHPDVL